MLLSAGVGVDQIGDVCCFKLQLRDTARRHRCDTWGNLKSEGRIWCASRRSEHCEKQQRVGGSFDNHSEACGRESKRGGTHRKEHGSKADSAFPESVAQFAVASYCP